MNPIVCLFQSVESHDIDKAIHYMDEKEGKGDSE